MNEMGRLARIAGLILAVTAVTATALAQDVRGVVMDQTGLPLPGATVQVLDGANIVATLTTAADGTFAIDAALGGNVVVASLQGFEDTRVSRADAAKITLLIARAAESTTVIATAGEPAAPSAPLLGGTLNANTVARLPSKNFKARESLPLLPAIIRGPDGLMQLGGARANDTPLLLDGFSIADPATGVSSVNLPFEAVRGVDVLRDPMAVSYGNLLGGMVRIDSKQGTDRLTTGVQGFIPRPRFSVPGFGRLEGIFPRAHIAGSSADRSVRYTVAAEWDYERIPVPEVTQGAGPDIVEQSAIAFARVDAQLTPRNGLTLEGFAFPSSTESWGLSPRRTPEAAPEISAQDLFAGLTHRFVANESSVFTIQIGVLTRSAESTPKGDGPSFLAPDGWTGNWFSTMSRRSTRYSVAATWDRTAILHGRSHNFSLSGEVAARRTAGRIAESPVVVTNMAGSVVRSVEFGAPASLGANDRPVGLALRDVWQVADRLQLDAGLRVDHSRYGGGAPSARAGIRYAIDPGGVTVIKAGYGSFVGNLPLAVPSFGNYPSRTDRWFDPHSGQLVRETILRPSVGSLRLPRAVAAVLGIERQLAPGLDAQFGFTHRRSSGLATFHVPAESGLLEVDSTGRGSYHEFQVSARRTWANDQQLFVSYVRSSAAGELNEFSAVFQGRDSPLVQPGGFARLTTDARDRVLAWGTFNLPRRIVVSPVAEWHSGFLYSAVNERYLYEGVPNSRSFPHFISTDMVVYKTVTVRNRTADLGIQIFNFTNRRNPRDVHPVLGTPRMGQFTNSVGPILRGYMLLKW
jgi:outer membrane receptor protein involved in Fe transport